MKNAPMSTINTLKMLATGITIIHIKIITITKTKHYKKKMTVWHYHIKSRVIGVPTTDI